MKRSKTNYSIDWKTQSYLSIKPVKSGLGKYFFYCSKSNIRVNIEKVKKEYIISFNEKEVNVANTLDSATQWVLSELNKPILTAYNEKQEADRVKLELEAAIMAEVKATVKLSYSVTNCDNDNLTAQLNKLLTQLVEKYQSKLGLPVAKDNYYGYHQDYSNFSVVELENGLCEFTCFIGSDIIQFAFDGHSSVNTAIIDDINKAINQYIKTGKIAKKAGKKPTLKLADNTNKSVKRSKEAIALAKSAKEIRNTYMASEKDRKWCPVERITSNMVRVVSKNGKLFVIVIDKFDYKADIDDTEKNQIKIFENIAAPHGNIDIAVSKVMLANALEVLGNTNISDITISQEGTNLVIDYPKGRYELVGLNSDELITMFHPGEIESVVGTENNETTIEVETVVTESPVIDITEGDNYILPSTQKVQLIETVVNDVIICEVVPSGIITEISLDDMVGIDLIDSQLFTETETETEIKPEIKPVNPVTDNIKIVHISDKNTDITESVIKPEIKPETTEFQQQITPFGDTDKRGYTQSTFLIQSGEGYQKRTGFVKGSIAVSHDLNCDTVIHLPSGLKIGSFNKGNVFVKGKKTTKKDVQLRVAKLVDTLNNLDFISSPELNKLYCLIEYAYMQSIMSDRALEESILSIVKMLEAEDEHNLLSPFVAYFGYKVEEEIDF